MRIPALKLYKFGGYAPLKSVLAQTYIELNDLLVNLSSYDAGYINNLIIEEVSVTKDRKLAITLLNSKKQKHREVLTPWGKAYQDLKKIFNFNSASELLGKTIDAYFFLQERDTYNIYAAGDSFILHVTDTNQEYESESLDELINYASSQRLKPRRVRIGRIYRAK